MRAVDACALADVVEDLLIAGLEADQQQPQPVLLQHFQRLEGNVRFGVARPRHAEAAETARDRFSARAIVSEGVVIEEELAHLREQALRVRHFGDDVID